MPRIAIIGASRNRRKFGNKAVRAYAAKGYEVFPVHPGADQIEGCKAYRSVLDVPVDRLDRISVYLPPAIGVQLLDEIARKPADQVWFNPGAADDRLLRRAKELGLPTIQGCSIVDIGQSPADFP